MEGGQRRAHPIGRTADVSTGRGSVLPVRRYAVRRRPLPPPGRSFAAGLGHGPRRQRHQTPRVAPVRRGIRRARDRGAGLRLPRLRAQRGAATTGHRRRRPTRRLPGRRAASASPRRHRRPQGRAVGHIAQRWACPRGRGDRSRHRRGDRPGAPDRRLASGSHLPAAPRPGHPLAHCAVHRGGGVGRRSGRTRPGAAPGARGGAPGRSRGVHRARGAHHLRGARRPSGRLAQRPRPADAVRAAALPQRDRREATHAGADVHRRRGPAGLTAVRRTDRVTDEPCRTAPVSGRSLRRVLGGALRPNPVHAGRVPPPAPSGSPAVAGGSPYSCRLGAVIRSARRSPALPRRRR